MLGITRAQNLTGVQMSPAGAALGLGDRLAEQVGEETEEMRRKRLALGATSLSPAGASLFGL